MNQVKFLALATALVLAASSAAPLYAQYGVDYDDDDEFEYWSELYFSGGILGLNKNDTAFRDGVVNVPVAVGLTLGLTPVWGVEADVSWFIPVNQEVTLSSGSRAERKSPDIITYQGNLVARLPVGSGSWSPYLTAGAGGMTFAKSDEPDRAPRLTEAHNVFATNFGLGTNYMFNPDWSLRLEFREFVAFPKDGTEGLSDPSTGQADPIWFHRGTVGFGRRF